MKDVVPHPEPPRVTIDVEFSPGALPRTERAPIAFSVASAIRASDGAFPPALEELMLELDRDSSIDGTALPKCGLPGRGPRLTLDDVKRICKDAIVGGGEALFGIAFPGETPIPASVRLVVFNGFAERRRTTLYAFGDLTWPLRATILMPIEIKKHTRGRIGTEANIAVPKVAGGNASLMELGLTLRRHGSGRSVMSLRCPDGNFLVAIRATFATGPLVRGMFPRTCRAKS